MNDPSHLQAFHMWQPTTTSQNPNPRPANPSWKYSKSKRRKFSYFPPKKKYCRSDPNTAAPLAPRNTTSFLMRASRSGGLPSHVSPFPRTPTVLTTPNLSPLSEGVVDMAKEEWGVDGYGSMKGLIRVRALDDDDNDDAGRFEMVCRPGFMEEIGGSGVAAWVLANRVDEQEMHVVQLEEANTLLKERVFFMERQMVELRRRVMVLEMGYRAREEERSMTTAEEVLDNGYVYSEKSVGD